LKGQGQCQRERERGSAQTTRERKRTKKRISMMQDAKGMNGGGKQSGERERENQQNGGREIMKDAETDTGALGQDKGRTKGGKQH